MLYSAERYDLSERVLKTITRTSKRSQAKNKKDRKALEEEEVVPEVSKEKEDREKALELLKATRQEELAAKRAEREKAAEDRKNAQQALRDAKTKEAADRRQKAVDARNKKSESKETAKEVVIKDTISTAKPIGTVKTDSTTAKGAVKKTTEVTKKPKTAAEIAEAERAQKLKDREARQKALQDRKDKIIEQRKKAREDREKQVKRLDSIANAKKNKDNN